MARFNLLVYPLAAGLFGYTTYEINASYERRLQHMQPTVGVVVSQSKEKKANTSDASDETRSFIDYKYEWQREEFRSRVKNHPAETADQFLERFPRGHEMIVYCDPDDPKQSLLKRQVTAMPLFECAFTGSCALVCLNMSFMQLVRKMPERVARPLKLSVGGLACMSLLMAAMFGAAAFAPRQVLALTNNNKYVKEIVEDTFNLSDNGSSSSSVPESKRA